jgi:uncharacterized protein YndB with AHSA1/START domain
MVLPASQGETMAETVELSPESDRELVLGRILDAPADKVWRAWTDPQLILQWFTPPPYRTVEAQLDVRPGGSSVIVMQAPDGTRFPNRGVYLAVDPGRRLVFTDAFTTAWEPSDKPFMVGEITLEPLGARTRYVARVRHWTVEDREKHEAMGFHQGWGIATEQLEALARSL